MGLENINIAMIGLGYVGLPLAVEFGKKYKTIGFDIDPVRVEALKSGNDQTLEVSREELAEAVKLKYTTNIEETKTSNVFIVTVPTPINEYLQPNLAPLKKASTILGKVIKQNDIIIYESTVYPGATEEVCVPILEQVSGLVFNNNFYIGYSPERINPGDRKHRVTNILKVTSGSTEATAELVDLLYKSIVTAGTHKASSIKVAEAAKVIENTQRDVNIALINELAIIFNRLGIDTEEVLKAAGTKWNFLPFQPGLVGGHCIGVDPYYLTYKSQSIGYTPEIILSSRRMNDSMGEYVASRLIKLMLKKRIHVQQSNILIMGLTFKENCPDIRNTRVVDIVDELRTYEADIHIYDPWVNPDEVKTEYGIQIMTTLEENKFDAIVLAVAHDHFKKMDIRQIRALGKSNSVIYDLKYLFPAELTDERL
ncbi:MAG: Vi polysaccharide biosynthesis UDP-N-acetylglucosamine C-6 dehydrogenase TviB [Methylococcaceae bacterium]|nr:Vi polysaccharide biosynthesis UDP-N-acetylglucosamine C-6 dehydrogenase TviB [Methylococcaceae bacterium]